MFMNPTGRSHIDKSGNGSGVLRYAIVSFDERQSLCGSNTWPANSGMTICGHPPEEEPEEADLTSAGVLVQTFLQVSRTEVDGYVTVAAIGLLQVREGEECPSHCAPPRRRGQEGDRDWHDRQKEVPFYCFHIQVRRERDVARRETTGRTQDLFIFA